jgi:hypothetical protein
MHMLQSVFYLTTALHVSRATITHLQEHKTTVTTASGNSYTVLLSAAIVEELELIWMFCGWPRAPKNEWISNPFSHQSSQHLAQLWQETTFLLYIYSSNTCTLWLIGWSLWMPFIWHASPIDKGTHRGAVGWGTAPQAGRSRVRFPMV